MKQSGSKSHEQEGVHKWQEFRHNAPHTKHALLLGEKNALATSAQHFTTFFGHFIFESFVLYKKKNTLDTTMRTVTDLLTSYFSHVMRKIETVTKVRESRNCLPTPNPERKQGHPLFSQCLKNT